MRHINDVNDNNHTDTQKKTIIVVSGDAGGIKGLISTEVLNYIEQQTGQATAEFADFFTGSSTATIVLTGLNSLDPNPANVEENNHPYYSAKHVRNSYFEDGPVIFPNRRKIWSEIVEGEKSLSSIFKQRALDVARLPFGIKDSILFRFIFRVEMFPSKNLERVLHKRFGHLTAKNIKKPFAFPSTNFSTAEPIWFTNNYKLAKNKNDAYYVPDMPMDTLIEACVRPSPAFKCKEITFDYVVTDKDGNDVIKQKTLIATDSAHFSSSPDAQAYEYAKELANAEGFKEDSYRIVLLSVGTGAREISNTLEDFKTRHIIDRIKHLIKIHEISEALRYRVNREQLKEAVNRNGDLYMRIESAINPEEYPHHPSHDFTDSRPLNMKRLVRFVHNTVIPENKKDLDDFITFIKEQDNDQVIEAIAKERLGHNYRKLKKPRRLSKKSLLKLKR